MKKVKLFIFLILLASCSSAKKGKEVTAENDDFSWIENSDFTPVKEIPYTKTMDSFPEEVDKDDTLVRESIAKVPDEKLEVVEKNEQDPLAQAVAYCYQKEYEKGLNLLDSIYKKYKGHKNYWNQMGTCYLLKGENAKSFLYYNKSRDLDKQYIPPINNLGVLYLKEGKDQKALAAFQKASQINSFALTPAFNLGQIYLKYGFVDKAEKIFLTLRQNNTRDIDVKSSLGTIYLMKGDYRKSVAYFNSIDNRYYRHPAIGLNFALALKLAGNSSDARKVFSYVENPQNDEMENYYMKVKSYIGRD